MEDVGRPEVFEFLAANGIDDRASEALLSAPTHIQDAVMHRGDLTDARNPSSAILGRIRDATKLLGTEAQESTAGADVFLLVEIESFVAENGVDERAADIMKSSAPEVVKHVIARGSLAEARNPSSALIGRIKDAQSELGLGKFSSRGTTGASAACADPDTLEAFITDNALDDRASEALRSATPEVQQAVILRGSLADTRNPSSAVLGRLRDAQSGNYEVAAGPRGLMTARQTSAGKGKRGGEVREEEVEQFLASHDIDERAQEALRSATPDVQAAVLARGDLSDTRNPSSALCGRIRDAQKEASSGYGGGGYGSYGMGGYGSKGGPSIHAHTSKGGFGGSGNMKRKVDAFIQANDIDERAGEALRNAGPDVQQIVLDRGDCKDTRNPSSAVQGRMRDAQAALAQGGGGGGGGGGGYGWDGFGGCGFPCFGKGGFGMGGMGGMMRMMGNIMNGGGMNGGGTLARGELERFIKQNNLDERAVEALQSATPEVVRAVIDRGSLKETRNPSSAVLGRLKDAQSSGGGKGYGGNGSGWMAGAPAMMWNPVAAFIRENNIDQRAADSLMSAPHDVQQFVLSRGGLENTRNPSSALLGRIRDAPTQMAESGMGGYASKRGGGGGALGPQMWEIGGAPPGMGGGDEVMEFITQNGLDSRAQEALLSASPEVQMAVIGRGSLKATRNPSSAVLGRIRDAQSGGGKGRSAPY